MREEVRKLLEKAADANDALMKYLNERVRQLDESNGALSARLAEMTAEKQEDIDIPLLRKTLLDWENLSFEEKKQLSQVFLHQIVVGDGTLEIIYH